MRSRSLRATQAHARLALFGVAFLGCAAAPPSHPAPTPVVVAERPLPPRDEPARAPSRELPGARERLAELTRIDRSSDRDERFAQTASLMADVRALADPRATDALATRLGALGTPNAGDELHWLTETAFALAELGDLRALSALAHRLSIDPTNAYDSGDKWQAPFARTDGERVAAARLIADLATLHPEERALVREKTEGSVLAWLASSPTPHANGMRALFAMRSQKRDAVASLRKWADPSVPLPAAGALPPFPTEFVIAQSALRYFALAREPSDWAVLEKQLARKPKAFDASMDALIGGGVALRGMAVRALAVGAANGFSEWGDAKSFPLLLAHLQDPKQNEGSRSAACSALVWVAAPADVTKLGKEVARLWRQPNRDAEFQTACLLGALSERPRAELAPTLRDVVFGTPSASARHLAARALGKLGLDAKVAAELRAKLDDASLGVDAALALLLGGSGEDAAAAVLAFEAKREPNAALSEEYRAAISAVFEADFAEGRLARWAENALAAERAHVRWPRDVLSRQLGDLVYDAGPHSLTRVVLRRRLYDRARSESDAHGGALHVLELLAERGSLAALGVETSAPPAAGAGRDHGRKNAK